MRSHPVAMAPSYVAIHFEFIFGWDLQAYRYALRVSAAAGHKDEFDPVNVTTTFNLVSASQPSQTV